MTSIFGLDFLSSVIAPDIEFTGAIKDFYVWEGTLYVEAFFIVLTQRRTVSILTRQLEYINWYLICSTVQRKLFVKIRRWIQFTWILNIQNQKINNFEIFFLAQIMCKTVIIIEITKSWSGLITFGDDLTPDSSRFSKAPGPIFGNVVWNTVTRPPVGAWKRSINIGK